MAGAMQKAMASFMFGGGVMLWQMLRTACFERTWIECRR